MLTSFVTLVLGLLNTILSYKSTVSEVLETEDDTNLDQDCVRSYTDEAKKKSTFMMGEIMGALSGFGCGHIVISTTHVYSLTVLGKQVRQFLKYFCYLFS